MKRRVTTKSRSRKPSTSTSRRGSRDPIDPTPRVIERKNLKNADRDSRRTTQGRSVLKKKRPSAKTTSQNVRQVGRAIGSVLGKVIGRVEQTVAKVMPGATPRKRRTS
ncbi:conserved hypothetical protein [Nitrospira defluvii]|uniref:Uncharacterized protein n=1 Tax=Nitrospira defluvii TaxID=330214 RepID=A0ABN7L7B5_9BACT|nr:conserved hypothetical protein [Nitrospira defluvii]